MNDEYYTDMILNKLKKDVVKGVAEILNEYSINIIMDEVNTYFINNDVVFLDPVKKFGIKESKTHIYRDRKNYKECGDRCIARIWNEGMGGQCSCKAKDDKFCKRHKDKGGYDWSFGTIDLPRPERPEHNGKLHIWLVY